MKHTQDNQDGDMCGNCSGTGEGCADGTVCLVCRGSGLAQVDADEPDQDDRDE